jgi:hypothetical protein
MQSGNWTGGFSNFEQALDQNNVAGKATPSAKLINQGQLDNVVLADQQNRSFPAFCAGSLGPVNLKIYPTATHYNVMVQSLADTLGWMQQLRNGGTVPSNCPG